MSNKGFIGIPLVVLALLIVGGALFFTVINKGLPQGSRNERGGFQINQTAVEWPLLWGPAGQNCERKASVKYSASPIDIQDIAFILPTGELREGHVVPGDHAGIVHETSPSSTPTKIFAPADGTIVGIERHPYTPPPGYPQNIRHYHVYITHSCTFFTGFVHITDFTEEILAVSPELGKLHAKNVTQYENLLVNVPVKAGQQIGTAWSFELLGIVTVDLTKTNKGYLRPGSYKAENWRPHAVSPFDYFEEPLRSQLHTKNPRKVEPRGGKIDFDIDGKIVGNWFEQGSGGFRDETKLPRQCGNFPCPYWGGHLALVYDFIDSTKLRVSVGYNPGLATNTPYGVKGNGPDFKDIGVEDGVVKYELVALKDVSKEKGYISETPIVTTNDEMVLGTILVQLLEKQKLKMEIFPGKMKEEVSSFTSKARTYTR